MEAFQTHMALYRREHRTLGCKITHMIGVPMIVASLPVLMVNWHISVLLFVVGWILQFMGHYAFEHNKPVLLADPKNPLTYFAAIVFVADEYRRLLSGQPLVDPAQ